MSQVEEAVAEALEIDANRIEFISATPASRRQGTTYDVETHALAQTDEEARVLASIVKERAAAIGSSLASALKVAVTPVTSDVKGTSQTNLGLIVGIICGVVGVLAVLAGGIYLQAHTHTHTKAEAAAPLHNKATPWGQPLHLGQPLEQAGDRALTLHQFRDSTDPPALPAPSSWGQDQLPAGWREEYDAEVGRSFYESSFDMTPSYR